MPLQETRSLLQTQLQLCEQQRLAAMLSLKLPRWMEFLTAILQRCAACQASSAQAELILACFILDYMYVDAEPSFAQTES